MNSTLQFALHLPRRVLIGLVKVYRLLLSPVLGNACRFEPTCSVFALRALEQHGALMGGCLTVGRLVRCQPWCNGGHDPVPPKTLFTDLFGHSNQQPTSTEKKSS